MSSDETFPSGPWLGFYTYSCRHQNRHRQDMSLSFANNVITGEGNDDIGPFIIKGRYDATTKECHWTKTYVGVAVHVVFYRGFGEGRGVWGTWEIGQKRSGGFHVWPLSHGLGDGDQEKQQQEEPLDVAVAVAEPVVM